MPLQADNLPDLIASTLKDLGEMKITEIATDLQDHVAMKNLLKKNRVVLESGTGIQWDVMVTQSGAARTVGLYASDNVNVGDVLVQANAPWRHLTTNYAFDAREMDMNRSPRRIVDLLKIRRIDCMISLAELMEDLFWRAPATTNTLDPYGVPYWITKNNTEGFNGGMFTGYTAIGGLSSTTYPRWQNWSGQYTSVTKDDLIRKMRHMAVKTNFRPPVDGIPTFNTGDNHGIYANYTTIGLLEEQLEAQNDNLGNDVASKDGDVLFRRSKVQYVPKLDADTTDPVYFINWGVFKTFILRGWWLKESKINMQPGQHTVASVHVDATLNWICRDRRRNGVLAKNTTYPF
jgi:hypothetical protein